MSAKPRALGLTIIPVEICTEEAVRRVARVTHLLMRADQRRRSNNLALLQTHESDFRREL